MSYNASTVSPYYFGNGTYMPYFDCPPGTEPGPYCWDGKILFLAILFLIRFLNLFIVQDFIQLLTPWLLG